MKFKVMFHFMLQQMYCDRRGNGQNQPGQNLPDKRLPGQKPPRRIEIEFVQGILSGIFVGEVGESWRGNQFSYKLSATIMPIYLFFFLHNIPIDNNYIYNVSQKSGIIIFYKFAKNDYQFF